MKRPKLVYLTGNKSKFDHANKILQRYKIEIEQRVINIEEIQSLSGKDICINKANKGYEIIKMPILVNDATWEIASLSGFPGPYMKYINKWFTPEDFLSLMNYKTNRKVSFIQHLVFYDGKRIKYFEDKQIGEVLYKPKGISGESSDKIFCFNDDKYTISEIMDKKIIKDTKKLLWEKFAKWYLENN